MQKNESLEDNYIDFVNLNVYLYCWGFHLSEIDKIGSTSFYQGIVSRLLKSLSALKQHTNKRFRKRSFIIWIGTYGDMFWIAVPGKMLSDVTIFIQDHLRGSDAYYGSDFAANTDLTLTPFLHYKDGLVIWYDEDLAGKEEYANDELGKKDLLVRYRRWRAV